MMVPQRHQQALVMLEAVMNHAPEVRKGGHRIGVQLQIRNLNMTGSRCNAMYRVCTASLATQHLGRTRANGAAAVVACLQVIILDEIATKEVSSRGWAIRNPKC
jgi:nucleoside-triphosphatase THEP1